MEAQKKCIGCGEVKPRDAFSPSGRGGRYRSSRCRPCAATRKREWVHNNAVHHASKRKEYEAARRAEIRAAENRRRFLMPEYWHWKQMNGRCHNPNNSKFPTYGARGIVVHESWRGPGGFDRFLAHIGRKPGHEYTIDRIDGTRGYEPGNVRWATVLQQARNRTSVVHLTIDGTTRPMSEWAEVAGVPYCRLQKRVRAGWDPLDALTAPVRVHRNSGVAA